MTTKTQNTTEIEFSFHSSQRTVFDSDARFRVLVAGRRFGKTRLAIMELIIKALAKEKALFWYVSPSYRQSKMIAWKMLKDLAPKFLIAKTNESELSITFKNNTCIELKGADNEDALRGAGLDGMVIDEFASIYDNWSVWNEVLRPALADKKGWVLFIGTPKGKDSFFELFMKGQREEDGFKSWQFKTVDNPYIDPDEVEQARKSTPERYFRQEYEASFEDFVGLIYPEFSERLHVIEPHFVQDVFPKIGAIDPALSGTTAGLKAYTDEDSNIVIYAEYYEKDKRASEVCRDFKEDKVKWLIDPASKAKNVQKEGQLYSLFDEYKEYGIRADTAENEVTGGINRVAEYFKANRIKIFRSCTNLLWEIERYHWAVNKETSKGEVTASPYKKDDHLMDCLRYIIAARRDKADLTMVAVTNPLSAWGKVAEMKRKAKRRR